MSNSKRRCPSCKAYNKVSDGVLINNRLYCSLECATKYASKNAPKAKAKQEKAERMNLRERKSNLKTIPELTREAQSAVNAYVRARDANKPCISCQVKTVHKFGGSMDAGHYRSRGSAAHLRFNVLNIHSQCVTCNRWQSGNVVDYRINLIKRIGIDLVERLESDNSTRKFDRDYLIRIKKIFNKRARWYKKRRRF